MRKRNESEKRVHHTRHVVTVTNYGNETLVEYGVRKLTQQNIDEYLP